MGFITPGRVRRRTCARIALAQLALAAGLALGPSAVHAQDVPPLYQDQVVSGEAVNGSLTYRFGVEYWVRGSWRGDFDFDPSNDDGLPYAWQRIKPQFSVLGNRFEVTIQGQDSRSGGMPLLNPNGTSTAPSNVRSLDFLKAYVKVKPMRGLSLKVGREQGDGIQVGVSRRLLSSTNYGAVLKSFDLASLKWDRGRESVMGFVSRPTDNLPGTFTTRRPGEVFWGVQSDTTAGRHLYRVYVVGKSITRSVLSSETGVAGNGVTYAVGVQESGPLLVPGVVWDIDALYEWGHRSSDTLSAWALFVNATHTFKNHTVWAGYHETSGDSQRGDGTTHLYDPFYASGFNEFGFMGFSAGRNIRHIKVGSNSKIAGPLSVYWTYHDQYLSERGDRWYGLFTPDILRPGAESSHLGQELNATLNFRFRFARRATIALGYSRFIPGAYVTGTPGPHASAQQWTLDVFGQL